MSIFVSQSSSITMLVFGIKNSSPPAYALYDADSPIEARKRIEARHPEYIYLGEEIMLGREDAKNLSRAFNKAMEIYPSILAKYPFKTE